jgi:tRNA (cmo5U34)-methyltransferase
MRQAAAQRLGAFPGRAVVDSFDLASKDWWPRTGGAGAVVSSLAVHHLDGPQKQRMFEAVARRLSTPGALVIADIVDAASSAARAVWAEAWERHARERSRRLFGSDAGYEDFLHERWNLFHHPDPDFDKPSPIASQLAWLEEAGFDRTDCLWLKAGHAVYAGYLGAEIGGGARLEGLTGIARRVLKE